MNDKHAAKCSHVVFCHAAYRTCLRQSAEQRASWAITMRATRLRPRRLRAGHRFACSARRTVASPPHHDRRCHRSPAAASAARRGEAPRAQHLPWAIHHAERQPVPPINRMSFQRRRPLQRLMRHDLAEGRPEPATSYGNAPCSNATHAGNELGGAQVGPRVVKRRGQYRSAAPQ